MNQKALIPVSILIAGLLIAGAVFLNNKPPQANEAAFANQEVDLTLSPLNDTDHIRGTIDAELVLVEFSDTECPFCKKHHEAIKELTTIYSPDEFSWVYRELPLTQLHSKAMLEAGALECASQLGGNEAFWSYTDKVYAETPSNNGLDLDLLPKLAVEIGLDETAFVQCLENEEWIDDVNEDIQDAVKSAAHVNGNVGTPYNILVNKTEFNDATLELVSGLAEQYNKTNQVIFTISKDHKRLGLSGALPIEMFQAIIDTALENI